MDQYVNASGLTDEYAIGNGQYTWDGTKYTNENGCEIRLDTIAQLFLAWNMYLPSTVMLNGPVRPKPNTPDVCGQYNYLVQTATVSL